MSINRKNPNYQAFLVALRADAPAMLERLFPKESWFWKLLEAADPKLLEPLLGFKIDETPPVDSPHVIAWLNLHLEGANVSAKELAVEAKMKPNTVWRFLSGSRGADNDTKTELLRAMNKILAKKNGKS